VYSAWVLSSRLPQCCCCCCCFQPLLRACFCICRCIQPYMPEHNSQQLIYAAANTGQLQLAEQQAQEAITYPKLFGPTHMSDGACCGDVSAATARRQQVSIYFLSLFPHLLAVCTATLIIS